MLVLIVRSLGAESYQSQVVLVNKGVQQIHNVGVSELSQNFYFPQSSHIYTLQNRLSRCRSVGVQVQCSFIRVMRIGFKGG